MSTDASSDTPADPDLLRDLAALALRLSGASGVELRALDGRSATAGVEPPTDETALPVLGSDGATLGVLRVADGGALERGRRLDLEALARVAGGVLEAETAAAVAFEAQEAAARAEDEVARVAGQVVHDLNNPLAAMAMSLEISRDQVDGTEQPLLASLLDRAAGSAERMKRMTADLLTFAQAPASGSADLQAEAEGALAEMEGLLPGRVQVVGALPRVAGSPGDVRVVLVALLENAVKFAGAGEPDVVVSAERGPDGVRVTVADRGRGIPAEEAERVFEPMVRLDKRIPGLGLGLSTVRRVVTAAGGSVGARPRPGGGAEVWFTLPAAD